MDRNEALSKFTDAAVEVLAVDPSKVTLEASFSDDLGADSLDWSNWSWPRRGVRHRSRRDELKDIRTVGEAFELIYAKL